MCGSGQTPRQISVIVTTWIRRWRTKPDGAWHSASSEAQELIQQEEIS
jgi:hypothetical protein